MVTKVKIITIILISLLMAGCVEQQTAKANDGKFTEIATYYDSGMYIYVTHDNINNVTIYTYNGHGIYAIPDWQLTAPKNYTQV